MKTKLLFTLFIISLNAYSQVCFYPHTEYAVGTNSNTKAITSGDFNGDGKMDLAVAIVTPSMVSILLGNGAGVFALASSYTIANTQPYGIVSADFNNDGKADVAVVNNGSALQGITILLGNGAGALTTAYTYTTTGVNPAAIACGDFNGDGKKDVAITNFNSTPGTVCVYMGNGNGTMGAATTYTVGTSPGGIVAADVTGDGKLDLVTANLGSNNITVLWNTTGAGVFSAMGPFTTGTGTAPRDLVAVDLDGNGKLDIVTCNTGTNSVSVLLNNGSGQYGGPSTIGVGTSPAGIATADFDGDGQGDVAVANSSGNNVSVLRGNGVNGLLPATNFSTATSPVKLVCADFNGDGKSDIATANENAASDNTSILLNSLPGPITVSGTATICAGKNNTLSASGATSYTWNPSSQTTTSIVVNPTATTTYSVSGTNTGCTVTATSTKTINVNPLPLVTANASATTVTMCTATSVTLTGGAAVSYVWSGGVTNGVGFMPTSTNTYTVTGTDGNNCSNTASTTVNVVLPATPSICLVTVDSLSQHNIILWDKSAYTNVDSFIIYREINSNNYQPIGAVHFDSLSMFIDTVKTKYFPNTGDPNGGTYRYKIQVRDTCGNYSLLSPYHNTIYMTNNSGSFSWPQLYTIEGSSNPVNSYVLMRDDNNTGSWHPINSVSGSQQTVTDPAYSSWSATANWRVQTMWTISCSPTMIKYPLPMVTTVNNSKSNNLRPNNPTSVNYMLLENSVSIFPNPNNGVFNLKITQFGNLKMNRIEIYDVYGEIIYQLTTQQFAHSLIDLIEAPNGIYFAHIETDKGTVVKKIVITR